MAVLYYINMLRVMLCKNSPEAFSGETSDVELITLLNYVICPVFACLMPSKIWRMMLLCADIREHKRLSIVLTFIPTL